MTKNRLDAGLTFGLVAAVVRLLNLLMVFISTGFTVQPSCKLCYSLFSCSCSSTTVLLSDLYCYAIALTAERLVASLYFLHIAQIMMYLSDDIHAIWYYV